MLSYSMNPAISSIGGFIKTWNLSVHAGILNQGVYGTATLLNELDRRRNEAGLADEAECERRTCSCVVVGRSRRPLPRRVPSTVGGLGWVPMILNHQLVLDTVDNQGMGILRAQSWPKFPPLVYCFLIHRTTVIHI